MKCQGETHGAGPRGLVLGSISMDSCYPNMLFHKAIYFLPFHLVSLSLPISKNSSDLENKKSSLFVQKPNEDGAGIQC
jgi:hypothetical protein